MDVVLFRFVGLRFILVFPQESFNANICGGVKDEIAVPVISNLEHISDDGKSSFQMMESPGRDHSVVNHDFNTRLLG